MILVSGGSGFVGRALVTELALRRRPVRILSRRPESAQSASRPHGVELVVGSFDDAASLDRALHSVQAVVHLAGATSGTSAHLRGANVESAAAMSRAAARARTPWFIHVSSAGVYGSVSGRSARSEEARLDAATPYELSKRDGESAVREGLLGSSTGHVVLRPAGIYGGAREETQAFLRDLASRRFWLQIPPAVIVHPTYVEDIVQAVVRCLDRPDLSGEVFNIGGECAMSLDRWAQRSAEALRRRLLCVPLPVAPWVASARTLCAAARALRVDPGERWVRACDAVISRSLDTGKARSRLGFVPTPVAQALRQTIEHARALGVRC
jgi:nucleoside-diphosphate-sugar epimerase